MQTLSHLLILLLRPLRGIFREGIGQTPAAFLGSGHLSLSLSLSVNNGTVWFTRKKGSKLGVTIVLQIKILQQLLQLQAQEDLETGIVNCSHNTLRGPPPVLVNGC